MPHGEFLEIKGTAHAGLFAKADEINNALIDFFSKQQHHKR
jgi:hypothetical protein